MSLILITACTSRKSAPVPDDLRLRDVAKATLDEVARTWATRINQAAPVKPAAALYAGRDYRRLIEAPGIPEPYIVSAGLGFLHPQTPVPAYDATVAVGVEDSVFARATGRFSPRDWFVHLQTRSRYAMRIKDLPRDGLILAALPARYLAMIADDLARIGPERLRLFTGSDRGIPSTLLAARMPYDGLLADAPGYNGPLVGFAERALRHFLTEILPSQSDADQLGHHAAVRDALRQAFDHRTRAG